jgi:hypothetical protein
LITPVTLSGTARDALRAAVRQLEEQYNDGDPFPDRTRFPIGIPS